MASAVKLIWKKKGILRYENDHYVESLFQDLVPFIPQEYPVTDMLVHCLTSKHSYPPENISHYTN